MNREEAKEILASQLRALKKLSYAEFRSWVIERRIETPVAKGPSGTEYQIEIEARWESKSGEDIRVLASIDEGGLMSSLLPLCDSFIIASDGSFVGEEDPDGILAVD